MDDSDRLNKLLGSVIISQGGVVPHIAPELRMYLTFVFGSVVLSTFHLQCPLKLRKARRNRFCPDDLFSCCIILYLSCMHDCSVHCALNPFNIGLHTHIVLTPCHERDPEL